MERRELFKTALLTISSLYGFSKARLCFAEKIAAHERHRGAKRNRTKAYPAVLSNERVLMPDVFARPLMREQFFIVAPEKNAFILLMPEKNPESKAARRLLDAAADREGLPVLNERAEMDAEGRLFLPDTIRSFAGIRTTEIFIMGYDHAITIMDSDLYRSPVFGGGFADAVG